MQLLDGNRVRGLGTAPVLVVLRATAIITSVAVRGSAVKPTLCFGRGNTKRCLQNLSGFALLLAQEQVQLSGVFLYMAHAVELQFGKREFTPRKPA